MNTTTHTVIKTESAQGLTHKLLFAGIVAGVAVVTGLGMVAYVTLRPVELRSGSSVVIVRPAESR